MHIKRTCSCIGRRGGSPRSTSASVPSQTAARSHALQPHVRRHLRVGAAPSSSNTCAFISSAAQSSPPGMLSRVQQHSQPFAFFTCDDALPPALLEQLLHLFPSVIAFVRYRPRRGPHPPTTRLTQVRELTGSRREGRLRGARHPVARGQPRLLREELPHLPLLHAPARRHAA